MNSNYMLKVTLVCLSVFTSVSSLSSNEESCLNNKERLVEETNDSITAVIENDSLAAVISTNGQRKETLEQVSRIK